MAAILKIFKYQTQFQFHLRYEKIVPNYAKKVFHGDNVIDDVTGWRQSFHLYSCLGDVGSANKGIVSATTLSILGLSRWSKNWNARNSYSYVATATKIRFHVVILKILRFLLKTHCRRRGWWYHAPHSSLFVCLFVCLSLWLSGQFNYEGLVLYK